MKKERDLIRQELLKLDHEHRLTPENVVKSARDPNSPMHPLFEWDNKVAATKYRLSQARTLITDFYVVVTVDRTEYKVNEFVEQPLKPGRQQGYTSVHSLVGDKAQAAAFLDGKLTVARTYADGALAYAVLLGMGERVTAVVENIDAVLTEVRSGLPPQAAAS